MRVIVDYGDKSPAYKAGEMTFLAYDRHGRLRAIAPFATTKKQEST